MISKARPKGAGFLLCPNWAVWLYVPDILFKVLQRAERAKGLIAFYVRVEPGFFVLFDVLFQTVPNPPFYSRS